MRRHIYYILFIIAFALISTESLALAQTNDRTTIIIEVEGDVEKHIDYINTYHPFIEVITSYSTIFNGLALKGKQADFEKIQTEDFIKAIHKNQTYQAAPVAETSTSTPEKPEHPTPYTGKKIKVAVIDTGIDYTHPDLKTNYTKGYDVYDFDSDPMETLPEDGMPTNHGTHVAGIIAANGEMEGVAKDAQIYAYRALGPGGFGSTVHILAALEQAVKDKVDIINLSLGNSVNGPDYPTSIAVNKAVALGIPVVIANGNSGPASWTVGAPATAESALSVGAATTPTTIQTLTFQDKSLTPKTMQGSTIWNLPKRDYQIQLATNPEASTNLTGKIALYQRGEIHFRELALQAQENGAAAVLIYNSQEGDLFGAIENIDGAITIPVAGISQEEGEWLSENEGSYIKVHNQSQDTTIADFSSRGPVAVNWHIKPDLLAPGTNIKSTIPGGYENFNGTSMAAPYVAGAIALIKEAHPNWEPSQIYSALKTTAQLLTDESGTPLAPSIQGSGTIQPEDAITTETIIHEPNLHYGKQPNKKQSIKIENLSNNDQHFTFEIPKQRKGITWKLPQSFTVKANETHTIEIELETQTQQLNPGIHEGYLQLTEKEKDKTYHLPYLFINNEAEQPITYGFEFTLKQFSDDIYEYQIYATEELASFTVDLYDPDTLTHQQRIIDKNNLPTGINKGEINKKELHPGIYTVLLTAQSNSGTIQQQETIIIVE